MSNENRLANGSTIAAIGKKNAMTRAFRATLRIAGGALRWMLSAAVRMYRAVLRNWLALAVLFLSLLVLGTGFVRIAGYTVFMTRGDYENAAMNKFQENYDEPDNGPPQPELFGQESTFDKVVIWSINTWCQTEDTVIGDRVAAKFNHALALYQDHKYSEAVPAFNKAYAACSNKGGKIQPKYRELASVIQLHVGNAYANQGKIDEAVAAYQLSLTYDPNNLITIYNLERLLSNGGGKGGGKGDKPQGNPLNEKI